MDAFIRALETGKFKIHKAFIRSMMVEKNLQVFEKIVEIFMNLYKCNQFEAFSKLFVPV
jgi:hypothetical protein